MYLVFYGFDFLSKHCCISVNIEVGILCWQYFFPDLFLSLSTIEQESTCKREYHRHVDYINTREYHRHVDNINTREYHRHVDYINTREYHRHIDYINTREYHRHIDYINTREYHRHIAHQRIPQAR